MKLKWKVVKLLHGYFNSFAVLLLVFHSETFVLSSFSEHCTMRSWRNLPAHFNKSAGFLAFSSGNRIACKALRSQLCNTQSRRAVIQRGGREREWVPGWSAPFPDISDSTVAVQQAAHSLLRGGESCSLLLIPPFSTAPQFPQSTLSNNSNNVQLCSSWHLCPAASLCSAALQILRSSLISLAKDFD